MQILRVVIGRTPTPVVLVLAACISISALIGAAFLDQPEDPFFTLISLASVLGAVAALYIKTNSRLLTFRKSGRNYADQAAKKTERIGATRLSTALAQIGGQLETTQEEVNRVEGVLEVQTRERGQFETRLVENVRLIQSFREHIDLQDALLSRIDEQSARQSALEARIGEKHNAIVSQLEAIAGAHDGLDSQLNTRIGGLHDALEKERSARVAHQEQTASQQGAIDAENKRTIAELKDLQDAVTRSSTEMNRLAHEQQVERVAFESSLNQGLVGLAESLESERAARAESEKHEAAILDDLDAKMLSRFEETNKALAEASHGINEQAQFHREETIERFGSFETNFRADLQSVSNRLQERWDSVPEIVKESVEAEFTIQAQYRDGRWQGSPWSSLAGEWEQRRGSAAALAKRVQQPGVIFLHVPKTGGTSIADAISQHYPHSHHWIDIHTVYEYVQKVHGLALSDAGAQELVQPAIWAVAYYHLQKGTKFVYGHILYNDFLARFKDSNYILTTLLRDPVERWLSHYFWQKYSQSAFKAYDASKQAGELIVPGMMPPVEVPVGGFTIQAAIDFTKTEWAQTLGSLQVRFLGGSIDDRSEESSKNVERAKRNLDEFDIVGTVEHVDRFLADFESATGDSLTIPHANKSKTPKDFQLLKESSELRAAIADICAPDIELYQYALTKT